MGDGIDTVEHVIREKRKSIIEVVWNSFVFFNVH
jgi:hypothetical protein